MNNVVYYISTEVSDISANYAAMASCTWIRKGLDIAKLPRVRLNNIQDLPGAKKKVNGFANR